MIAVSYISLDYCGGIVKNNLFMYTNKKAPKDNILCGLKEIEKKAKKDDFVIVFFAGHGEIAENGGMLFLTYDTDTANPDETAIKFQSEFETIL